MVTPLFHANAMGVAVALGYGASVVFRAILRPRSGRWSTSTARPSCSRWRRS